MSGKKKTWSLDQLLSKKLKETGAPLEAPAPIQLPKEPEAKAKKGKKEAASLSPPSTSAAGSLPTASSAPDPTALVGGCVPCAAYFRCPKQMLLHLARHMPDLLFLNPMAFADASPAPPLILPPALTVSPAWSALAAAAGGAAPAAQAASLASPGRAPAAPLPSALSSPVIERKEATSLSYYMCSECSATFETKALYERHMAAHESVGAPGKERARTPPSAAFKCSECPASFADVNRFQEHVTGAHGRSFTAMACQICGEVFGTSWELNRHQGSHTGGTHLCQKCGKCFRSRKTLHSHVREHQASASPGGPAFVCEDCGADFGDELGLDLHSQTHHSDAKPLSCAFCDARFPFRRDLEAHVQKSHYLEAFASGSLLGKAAVAAAAAQRDSAGLSDETICPECGDAFESRSAMEAHKRVHLGAAKERADRERAEREERASEERGHSYPKYRAVTHSMSNDYLNGLLEGIVHRHHSPSKRRGGTGGPPGSEEMVSSTTAERENSSRTDSASPQTSPRHSPTPPSQGSSTEVPTNGALPPTNLSPLSNQYFRGLVESNVKKYSRQRIKDPLADYMGPQPPQELSPAPENV